MKDASTDILIFGGGFAGLWAALYAAWECHNNDVALKITMLSKDDYLTIRPRLYQRNPNSLRVPLSETLDPLNIEFRKATVSSINTHAKTVGLAGGEKIAYKRLVFAAGSHERKLPIPGAAHYAWSIDTIKKAAALDHHINTVFDPDEEPASNIFVVVGAGLTGIELACELRDRIAEHAGPAIADQAHIILVERSKTICPGMNEDARAIIENALKDAEVEIKTDLAITDIAADKITLSDCSTIDTQTTILTAGLEANRLTARIHSRLAPQGRLIVDENLCVPDEPAIFAAGDVACAYADEDHETVMSCQHAMTMGKFAGYNAVRDLLGLPLIRYRQPDYVTCLDLGRTGALFTTGWDRKITKTGMEAKAIKKQINTKWIYPPTDTKADIFAALDPSGL